MGEVGIKKSRVGSSLFFIILFSVIILQFGGVCGVGLYCRLDMLSCFVGAVIGLLLVY